MSHRLRQVVIAGLLALVWVPATLMPAGAAPPRDAAAGAPADVAFDRVWARTDQLVRAQNVSRSWYWGTAPFARLNEPFAGGTGGTRLVEYFDKSRMEINDPAGNRNSPWFVTNGLLVKELMTGQVVVGPTQTETRAPSTQPVVGDWVAQNAAPSYAMLARVASLGGGAPRTPNRVGQHATATLDNTGRVGTAPALGTAPTRLGTYVEQVGHNIPDIFWNFLTAQGQYLDGQYLRSGPVVDWIYAFGYPISEPYWVRARVGTSDRDVLVQAFERRILTYTPGNAPAWQVEMANVGRHYYDWRYGATHPGALAPPVVATRIVSTAVHLDARIIPTYIQNSAWQVADYAAGWLYGTSQPGQPGNSVFAGHNNWHGEVFRYLEFLHPGDEFTIYTSDNQAHRYRVGEVDKLPQRGVSQLEIAANARYMDNTPDERVTLITCWPYVTYTHRLIVVGYPVH